jgi:hypothetical protein
MKTPLFLLLTLFLLAHSTGYAQAVPKSSLADVRFIAGHWQGTASFGGSVEALFSVPTGDNMLGTMRMMKDDKATLYEILVLEQTEPGVTLAVKHFKPGLLGQEEKDQADRYALIERGDGRVVFEKQGGSPLRVIWEKRPNGGLAVVRGTQQDGQWRWSDLFVFKPAP